MRDDIVFETAFSETSKTILYFALFTLSLLFASYFILDMLVKKNTEKSQKILEAIQQQKNQPRNTSQLPSAEFLDERAVLRFIQQFTAQKNCLTTLSYQKGKYRLNGQAASFYDLFKGVTEENVNRLAIHFARAQLKNDKVLFDLLIDLKNPDAAE